MEYLFRESDREKYSPIDHLLVKKKKVKPIKNKVKVPDELRVVKNKIIRENIADELLYNNLYNVEERNCWIVYYLSTKNSNQLILAFKDKIISVRHRSIFVNPCIDMFYAVEKNYTCAYDFNINKLAKFDHKGMLIIDIDARGFSLLNKDCKICRMDFAGRIAFS